MRILSARIERLEARRAVPPSAQRADYQQEFVGKTVEELLDVLREIEATRDHSRDLLDVNTFNAKDRELMLELRALRAEQAHLFY